jgi:hypothetical protein
MQNRHNPPVHGSEKLPSEPDNYLANRPNDWAAQLRASGHTVTDIEPPTDTRKYCVTFVPSEGAPCIKVEMRRIPVEPCPACGTMLETGGRCRACWGDVMGLCDTCNRILDEGSQCPTCAPNEPVIPMV